MSSTEASQPSPYDEIIGDSQPASIQSRYETHRTNRNAAQREKLLSGTLQSLDIDPILYKVVHPGLYPDFKDERHCLVFWARPPQVVRLLIKNVQERLKRFAPAIVPMPPENLHMTVMEIAHSLTKEDLHARVDAIRPKIEEMTDYTFDHRARLVKPMVSYDASAVALSFVPAAGEGSGSHDDSYTYHHLRRDIWSLCRSTGVEVASRYVVPSAHLTLGRFVSNDDHATEGQQGLDAKKMQAWLRTIDEVNEWLREMYWPKEGGEILEGGEWIVGTEKGLSLQAGTIWYGSPDEGRHGKQTVRVGKGFRS